MRSIRVSIIHTHSASYISTYKPLPKIIAVYHISICMVGTAHKIECLTYLYLIK